LNRRPHESDADIREFTVSHAVRIHAHGGADVLVYEHVPLPEPGPGEALIHHTAIGLNFIDIYYRNGLYKVPELPVTLGMEGAGIVRAIGPGVDVVKPGDRVAYAGGALGAYATDRVIHADRLVRIPDEIDDRTAATMMMQGMTAAYLLHRTYPVKAGEWIVVHAAAGGVGLIMCQWARHLGVKAIGVVSSEAKAALARANGAAETVVGYGALPAAVKKITGGAMVPVVYDSVGKDSFSLSLECLAPLGMMVSYGSASGPVPPVDLAILGARGSLFLTRPSLAHYAARRADIERYAGLLFDVVRTGAVKVSVNQEFKLADVAAAHRAMESRATTGSTVLIP
jgi:NADPH:quinone reductase